VSKRLARKLTVLANRVNTRKEEKQMSKMSDMAATIEELRNAAAAINDAANWLAEAFSGYGRHRKAPAENRH
jgi:hypothetical protein